MIEVLGLDILMEILSRLCVKDLIRLKSVSKAFSDLISDEVFIHHHLHKSSFRAIQLSITTWITLKQRGSSLRVIHVDENRYICNSEEENVMGTMCFAYSYYGSCNGLVCLLAQHDKYVSGALLWNPALHEAEFVPIKKPEKKITFSWFGYHDGEYKLILGTASHIHLIRLYIDTDSWKSSLKIDERNTCCFSKGTLVHDTVHWFGFEKETGEPTIVSYDIRNETVGDMRVPGGTRDSQLFVVGRVDGCLSTMFTNQGREEIWAMKEYGVQESWTKLVSLPLQVYLTYRGFKEPNFVVELDDPAQLASPIFDNMFYVESLISPRSIKTNNMCMLLRLALSRVFSDDL